MPFTNRPNIKWPDLIDDLEDLINTGSIVTAYQRSTDIRHFDLFSVDFMESASSGGMPFNAAEFAHWPSKGWVVLFTDGSANFVFSPGAYAIATSNSFVTVQSQASCVAYDKIFTDLVNDSK